MNDSENPVIVEGLAAFAVSMFEMGKDDAGVRDEVIAWWNQFGRPAGLFRVAADAVKELPQPLSESPETIERMRPIREALGVTSADDSLTAALKGRELLERLAREFG
ncbi:MAG TPA: hypothetical protein VGP24_04810 [Glaciihabitans sp.]|jgi:hypothetical protein|nr:hypothetical protein [Glaciihabitans sp.]